MIRVRSGTSRRAMAYSAAAMYGGASFVGIVEQVLPGGASFSLAPTIVATIVVAVLLLFGPRLPVPVLATLGPIGAILIGVAIATTRGHGDGVALYAWPVLWQSYFFGRRGTVLILACVGVVDALALNSLPSGVGHLDRWLDVMTSMVVVGLVVDMLSARNERLLDRLAAEARIDDLTNLLNRRGFLEAAEAELARSARAGTPVGIVSFDIDHFKHINDEFGHDVGDRVLEHLADVFRRETRQGDLVARLGGEEFVALLVASRVPETVEYAERVRAAFAAAPSGAIPRTTLSAGVTATRTPGELHGLLNRADAALYAAKRAGRDRTVIDSQRKWTSTSGAPATHSSAVP